MNLGEQYEYLIKFALVLLRDSGHPEIKTVGFGNHSYGSLPEQYTIDNLLAYSWSPFELKRVAELVGINKAPARAKSDVYINGIGYSLKYSNANPPAILNHTPRHSFLKVCMELGIELTAVDHMVNEYWQLRKSGLIKEDVPNSSPHSPFKKKDPVLVRLIEYFIFDGTGSGKSNFPAEYVLEFSNPIDPATWKIYNRTEIVDMIWDNLVFSLRSKGMPDSYQHDSDSSRDKQIRTWTNYRDGKYKGALHIRVKK